MLQVRGHRHRLEGADARAPAVATRHPQPRAQDRGHDPRHLADCFARVAAARPSPRVMRQWATTEALRGERVTIEVAERRSQRITDHDGVAKSPSSGRESSEAGVRPACEQAVGEPGGSVLLVKEEPCPDPALSAHMVPPISSASSLLMANPSPVPPYLRVVPLSAWLNFWNRRDRPCSDNPMPVSRTVKCSRLPSPVCSSPSVTVRIVTGLRPSTVSSATACRKEGL